MRNKAIKDKISVISRTFLLSLLFVFAMLVFASRTAEARNPYPDSLKKWVDAGKFMKFEGLDVFVHSSGKAPVEGHGVLIVHGFSGSSRDFSKVVPPRSEEDQSRCCRHAGLWSKRQA